MSVPQDFLSLARRAVQRADRNLPWLFLLIAAPMMVFFALKLPIGHMPDEPNHLYRASQISHGEITGIRLNQVSRGGLVEKSYVKLFDIFPHARLHPDKRYGAARRTYQEALAAAKKLPSSDQRTYAEFPGVEYGPVGYVPQVLALFAARALRMDVVDTVILARLCAGIAALALAFAALRIARGGRFFIFTMLTLPMSLFLSGSLSHDAILLGGAALFVALASDTIASRKAPTAGRLLAMIVILGVISWERQPYLGLGAVFLTAPFASVQWRSKVFSRHAGWGALAATLLLFLAWNHISAATRTDVYFGHAYLGTDLSKTSIAGQWRYLMSHPAAIPAIAFETFRVYGLFYVQSFFGLLGLYEVPLPKLYYGAALLALVAGVAGGSQDPALLSARDRTVIALGLLAGAAAIFAALYLTWTPVGASFVEGVQGRYFIPLALACCLILPVPGLSGHADWKLLNLLVPAVAILGALVSVQATLGFYV